MNIFFSIFWTLNVLRKKTSMHKLEVVCIFNTPKNLTYFRNSNMKHEYEFRSNLSVVRKSMITIILGENIVIIKSWTILLEYLPFWQHIKPNIIYTFHKYIIICNMNSIYCLLLFDLFEQIYSQMYSRVNITISQPLMPIERTKCEIFSKDNVDEMLCL